MLRRNTKSPRTTLGVATLLLALVSGLCLLTPARADGPSDPKDKAITAMTSKASSLRQAPDGSPHSVTKKSVGDSSGQLGNSDLMGTPADQTVLRSQDQMVTEQNVSDVAAGNATAISTLGLNETMTAPSSEPAPAALAARATIDHQYPAVHGHFLNSTSESVLAFKNSLAGPDSLYNVAAVNSAAEKDPFDPRLDQISAAGTYVIKTGGNTAVTNQSVAASTAVGEEAGLQPLPDDAGPNVADYSQQWAVIYVGQQGSEAQLVNRADGLCLVHTTSDTSAQVVTAPCSDDSTRLWTVFAQVGGLTQLFVPDSTSGVIGLANPTGNSLTISSDVQAWEAHQVGESGGSVPTWSTVRTGGAENTTAPYAMAAGDLDQAVRTDSVETLPTFHDEAVVAYTDSDNHWALRVLDYNANPGHLLVTAPDPSIQFGQTGTTLDGIWNPGDLVVNVGDFNGDGRNEIATASQNGNGDFQWTFWRYAANPDGSRSLTMLSSCLGCGGTPFTATSKITLQQGYASSAVGDFDGDGRDDIALAYANNVEDPGRAVNLGIWTVNPDLTTRSVEITTPSMSDGYLPPSASGKAGEVYSGIQLVTGYLLADPGNGFGPKRSQLAIAWEGMKTTTVYNPSTTKDETGFHITPLFNIYKVELGDCNNAGTTCTTSTTPTNGDSAPQNLFPSNPEQTAYRNKGTSYDPPPLTLEVGAFGGDASTDPPVDGLIANAWLEWNEDPSGGGTDQRYYNQQSIIVPWQSGDATNTKWTITDSQVQNNNKNWILIRYLTYDRLGKSVVLGAPQKLDLEQNIKENVVAAEPPTHVDWLNGDWSNISATANFYLQTQTSKGQALTSSTSNENSWSNGAHEGLDVNIGFRATIAPFTQAKGYLDVNQKFSQTWTGLSQDSDNASNSWSTSAAAQTNQDDAFSYSADDTTLYRYPVIGGPGQVTDDADCKSGCRVYYDVYIPQDSAHFDNVPGKSTSLFQPAWQNMNALSYPQIDSNASNPVPTPDLAGYSFTDAFGKTVTVDKPLYNQSNTISSNSGTVTLDFSTSAGATETVTHSRTLTSGTDVTLSGKVTVGTKEDQGYYSSTASAGFDASSTNSDTNIGSSSTSSSQQFILNVPAMIDAGRSYEVGTAYYYSQDGAAKVVHGVDLTNAVEGKEWWLDNYANKPDPALNLPNRIELTYDPDNYQIDKPLWLTAPQRQLIRGFQVLQAENDDSGLPTAGMPYTVNPQVGQTTTFQIPIHNYSLTPTTAGTTATWYVAPVDIKDSDLTGPVQKIGTSTVKAIDAQGTELVQSPSWTAVGNSGNTMQQYRVFVRLDEAGTGPDLHPLDGDACPVTSLEPTDDNQDPVLNDTMSQNTAAVDPLGCGQNNQGYRLVTVSPAAPSSNLGAERHATSEEPARAKLAGGGLVDGNPDHLYLTEDSDVPTVPVGQRITGLVHASAAAQSDDHPIIAVYDGPVKDGKIIAVTRMNGIDDKTGGHVPFSWTPDTAGVHELHHVLLGTKATGEDDEQIMRVNVAAPRTQYTVSAKASAAAVMTGRTFTVGGKISPVPGQALYRTVALQQKVGDGWKDVDSQETSSTGAFAFDITAGKAATYSYRVLKLPSPGRRAALSALIKVVVENPFAITTKVTPTTTDTGKTVTFTGKVTPPQSKAADRTIDLQVKSGASWKTVKSASTTASGNYKIAIKPTTAGTFSYRVTKRATIALPAKSSAAVTLKVIRQFTVTAHAKPSRIKAGSKASISGTVMPTVSKASERRVVLQIKKGATWKAVSSRTTEPSGAYSFSIKPTGTGTYRVVKAAAAGKRTAYSPGVAVTVVRR